MRVGRVTVASSNRPATRDDVAYAVAKGRA